MAASLLEREWTPCSFGRSDALFDEVDSYVLFAPDTDRVDDDSSTPRGSSPLFRHANTRKCVSADHHRAECRSFRILHIRQSRFSDVMIRSNNAVEDGSDAQVVVVPEAVSTASSRVLWMIVQQI